MASARLIPSNVAVPRPNSSNKIKLFLVACVIALLASNISTINVDSPPTKSSDAPIRVNMASNTGNIAFLAGTKEPI